MRILSHQLGWMQKGLKGEGGRHRDGLSAVETLLDERAAQEELITREAQGRTAR